MYEELDMETESESFVREWPRERHIGLDSVADPRRGGGGLGVYLFCLIVSRPLYENSRGLGPYPPPL